MWQTSATHEVNLQLLDGPTSIYQNQLRLNFRHPQALQYTHRLDLLPGSYALILSVDGKSFPYSLTVAEQPALGEILRVNEAGSVAIRKPLAFEGRAFNLSAGGKFAMVTLPQSAAVTWTVRKGVQVISKYQAAGSAVTLFEIPAQLEPGKYSLEAESAGVVRGMEFAVGKAEESLSESTILSFNANLLPSQRFAFVGHQWLLRGNAAEARRYLQKSLASGATKEAETEMARAEALSGQWDSARDRVRAVLARYPDDFESLSVLAYVETKLQDYAVAARLYRRALALQDSPALRLALRSCRRLACQTRRALLSLKRVLLPLGIAVILFLVPAATSAAAEFVWLSDIHFDPFADPALVDKLAAVEPAQWVEILTSASAKFPAFGHDTSWPLFSSAIEATQKAQSKAAFTIVTGDLLAHHFRELFNAAASVHDDEAFRSFVRKSMEFTALQLKRISPGTPIFVSLGNNDDLCGDYLLQPNGPFLHDTGKLVADLAGVADVDSFSSSWSANGSYTLPHPTLSNRRIIVLNTVFFSPRYRDSCGHSTADPGEDLLAWLAKQLAEATSRRERVWLVYHIPPGVDAFATTHPRQPSAEGNVTLLWKESYTSKFVSLLDEYRGVVGPNFAGHLHIDDFRLLGGSSKHSAFVVIGPAISPNIGQNPAFRLVTFDSRGRLTDQATYFLSNLTDVARGALSNWQLEYSFRNEWRAHELNAASYQRLYRNLDQSPQVASRWTLLYPVSKPGQGSITATTFRQFYCAIGNILKADYQSCVTRK